MISYKSLITAVFLLTSCTHLQKSSPTSSTLWLDSFKPSGSFCIDAYTLNSAATGCTSWSTRDIRGITEFRCTESNDSENFWNASTFIFVVPALANGIEINFHAVCGDMNGTLGVLLPE
jgi:hypothetical protein|tara:strand:- start:307 stop:663 length:357 start_codon:yes stop_codon:yes gene_type:complete